LGTFSDEKAITFAAMNKVKEKTNQKVAFVTEFSPNIS
jgi:hypothetical protein